jgi:hypothetical protein
VKRFALTAGLADVEQGVAVTPLTFPPKQWPITTRELTAHTAGIRHYRSEDFIGPLKGAPHFESVSRPARLDDVKNRA